MKKPLISIVVPCYNESKNVRHIFDKLVKYTKEYNTEIIFIDDGSRDDTVEQILILVRKNEGIKLIELSRNFGKEAATSAGIKHATGDATILIDADGQHPPELIPDLIKEWQNGHDVVIGVRKANKDEGYIKKYGSIIFYNLFNRFSGTELVPGSTDFRLIDRKVQAEFNKLNEKNRITRGLIDWLGFKKSYIEFSANPRLHGEASYSFKKLLKLAINSFVSLSFTPLFIMGYFGLLMCVLSVIAGVFAVIEDLVLGDPMALNFTGSGYLAILTVFLIGCVLISQSLTSLYISHIYQESLARPLFIVDKIHTSTSSEK